MSLAGGMKPCTEREWTLFSGDQCIMGNAHMIRMTGTCENVSLSQHCWLAVIICREIFIKSNERTFAPVVIKVSVQVYSKASGLVVIRAYILSPKSLLRNEDKR